MKERVSPDTLGAAGLAEALVERGDGAVLGNGLEAPHGEKLAGALMSDVHLAIRDVPVSLMRSIGDGEDEVLSRVLVSF